YSLIPGKFEVSYADMEAMAAHSFEKHGTYDNNFFYIPPGAGPTGQELPAAIATGLEADCHNMIRDWQNEIHLFKRYLSDISNIEGKAVEKLKKQALTQRLFFKSITDGMHGNLLLKLRFIEAYRGVDTETFYKRFFDNRNTCVTISNMYRKAYVLLDETLELYEEIMARIRVKVEARFIEESAGLLQEFKKIVSATSQRQGEIKNERKI
ncbi:MAG: hypothetical protein GY757_57860, partial [bacterium]|nr:hypothetical protein [bacterium]